MKIKPKSFFSKASTDLRKSVSLDYAMKSESDKIAKEDNRPVRIEQTPAGATKVTVNVSGNRRGMHNAENPPDSETMSKRRAMRKLWNKKMPQLHCSNCQLSAQCPEFRGGYVCSFLPFLNSHSVETEDDLMFYMKELLTVGLQRAQQTIIMERLTGATPSLETTESVAYLFNQFLQLHQALQKASQTSITVETSDNTIIGRLFGNLDKLVGSTKHSQENAIDVPFFSGENRKGDPLMIPEKTGNADDELLRELAVLRDKKDSRQAIIVDSSKIIQEELV